MRLHASKKLVDEKLLSTIDDEGGNSESDKVRVSLPSKMIIYIYS